MQVTGNPAKGAGNKVDEGKLEAERRLVEELKVEWKLMWSEHFNDKVKAEGVSVSDYTLLRVDRGTIIHAIRDFKDLNFKEIVQQHMIEEPDRFIQPDVSVGGWNKFIKTKIINNAQKSKHIAVYVPGKKNACLQPKKGGRGWLHLI